uniref:Ervatamin-B n=1 Tax=Aegilops tauschii TaxID=37682 RepID=M8CFI5_AEGTA
MEAVAKQSVTVIIEVAASFAKNKSGVYSGPCGYDYNHIVTIVGYGKDDAAGKKYWIVKNSHGTSFGMDGYILMERDYADSRGLCGLCLLAHLPYNVIHVMAPCAEVTFLNTMTKVNFWDKLPVNSILSKKVYVTPG